VTPYMTWTGEEIEEALPEELKFDEQEEEVEEERIIPQDYLPQDYVAMNETLHPEYTDFKFDTKVRGGQIGTRSIPETKPVSIGGDDEEEGADGKKKHPVKDRPCYDKAWEVSPEGFNRDNKPPLHVYDIMRGGGGGGGGLFAMLSLSTPEKCVGKMKVRCRAFVKESPEHLEEPTHEDRWAELGRDKKMTLRFYLIRGINLMAQDDDGFSDPFVNVMVTNHEPIMDKERTLRKATLQPNFYTYYEFKDVVMPGDHTLTVEVWDEDLMSDDIIGKVKVDLEDRHYTRSWYERDIETKKWQPKEWLPIMSPSSAIPQGRLECWIDLLDDKEGGQIPVISLEPPRGDPWELRVVCWKVTDLNFRDKTSIDLFCSGMVEFKDVEDDKMKRPTDRQDTDCQWFMEPEHYGSFHWRWIFPVKIPCNIPKLLVQTWDLELLTPNDAICEANIQLGSFFKASEKKGAKNAADLDLGMTHPNFKGIQGTISLSIELMPEKEAEDDPVDPDRQPELMDREGMYTYYRPPGAFPAFGLMAILKAKLKPLKKYCIMCCILLIIVGVLMVVVMVSDEQLKESVVTIRHSDYERIGLRAVEWKWNQQANERLGLHGRSYGVVAQEVEKLYPWLVQNWPDGYKRVNYGLMNIMVHAAKLHSFLW